MNSGFSIFTVLFLIFMTLKLLGSIAWSWWWVTAPLWGPFVIGITIFAFVFTYAMFKDAKGFW
jgi:hypothetical protein